MAVGDVASEITSIAAGAHMIFQPAAGDEYAIKNVYSNGLSGTAPNKIQDVSVGLNDDTLISLVCSETCIKAWFRLPIYINNTHYLDIENTSGSTQNLGYSGLMIKD